jgi:hypothetical protein
MEEAAPIRPRMATPEPPPVRPVSPQMQGVAPIRPQTVPVSKPSTGYVPAQGATSTQATAANIPRRQEAVSTEQPAAPEQEIYEEVLIGQQKIKLAIPAHVIRQAQSSSTENKNKLAGYWSAQILKGNPNLTHASVADPVSIWFEVKNVILKKFNSPPNTNVKMTSS